MHEQSSNCLFGKILRDPSDRRCCNRPIPELENDEEGLVADEYGRTWLALFVGGGTQLSQVHHRNHLCAAWKPSNPQCCDTPFREFNRSLDAGGGLYVSCCYKARYTYLSELLPVNAPAFAVPLESLQLPTSGTILISSYRASKAETQHHPKYHSKVFVH